MKKIVILDGKTLGRVDYIKLNEFGQVTYYDETAPNQVAERIKEANIILTNKVVNDEPSETFVAYEVVDNGVFIVEDKNILDRILPIFSNNVNKKM